jgi:hypothetical protein
MCGTIGDASDEHVVPKWIRRLLDIRSEVTLLRGDELEEIHSRQHLTVRLRGKVCTTCNNGWMSKLESDVQPFLGQMLLGNERLAIDEPQRRLLTTWATKTILLTELALRQQHPRSRPADGYEPSDFELAWLSGKRRPIPRSRLWVGPFDAQGEIAMTHQTMQLELPTGLERGPIKTHLTTFSLGYVVFQLHSIDALAVDEVGGAHFPVDPPESLSAALLTIWPSSGQTLWWPPPGRFTRNNFDRLATWEGRFSPDRTGTAVRLPPPSLPD